MFVEQYLYSDQQNALSHNIITLFIGCFDVDLPLFERYGHWYAPQPAPYR
jgi:hypothetical protein